jgi:hypothetical protein
VAKTYLEESTVYLISAVEIAIYLKVDPHPSLNTKINTKLNTYSLTP